LKVHGFGGSDADQDSQDFHAGGPLRHRRVEAGTALFDRRHVESRCVGDCLDVVLRGQVGVASGNCWKLSGEQTGHGLRKYEGAIKIRVVRAAPVSGPPARIDRELHEVRESPNLLGAGRFAARQSAELVQIGRGFTLRFQVSVEERKVSDLIVRVVVNVLGKVAVKYLKGSSVS
jgi:hypothetical protein